MIIIRHAWLNLKRNRNSHLKTGCFMLVILLVIYSLVQCYQLATAYYADYQEQAAPVVKGVQDLNQTGQAKEFNLTDYENLKNQDYVKQAQFVGEGVVATSLLQPKQAQSGELKNSDGEVYAKYTIDVDGNIRFEFTDEVKNQSDIN